MRPKKRDTSIKTNITFMLWFIGVYLLTPIPASAFLSQSAFSQSAGISQSNREKLWPDHKVADIPTSFENFTLSPNNKPMPADAIKSPDGNQVVCVFSYNGANGHQQQNVFGYVAGSTCMGDAWGVRVANQFYYIQGAHKWVDANTAKAGLGSKNTTTVFSNTKTRAGRVWSMGACTRGNILGKHHGPGHAWGNCYTANGGGEAALYLVPGVKSEAPSAPAAPAAASEELWPDHKVDGIPTSFERFKLSPSSKPMPADAIKSPDGKETVCVFRFQGGPHNQAQNVFGYVQGDECWGIGWGVRKARAFSYLQGAHKWVSRADGMRMMTSKAFPTIFSNTLTPNTPRFLSTGACIMNGLPGKHNGPDSQQGNCEAVKKDGLNLYNLPSTSYLVPEVSTLAELGPDHNVNGIPTSFEHFKLSPSSKPVPADAIKSADGSQVVCVSRIEGNRGYLANIVFGYLNGDGNCWRRDRTGINTSSQFYYLQGIHKWVDAKEPDNNRLWSVSACIPEKNLNPDPDQNVCEVALKDGSKSSTSYLPSTSYLVPEVPAPEELWPDHKVDGVPTSFEHFKLSPSNKPVPADAIKDPDGKETVCVFRYNGANPEEKQNVFGYVRDNQCWGKGWGDEKASAFFYIQGAHKWVDANTAKAGLGSKNTTTVFSNTKAGDKVWSAGMCTSGDTIGTHSGPNFAWGSCYIYNGQRTPASLYLVPNITAPKSIMQFDDTGFSDW